MRVGRVFFALAVAAVFSTEASASGIFPASFAQTFSFNDAAALQQTRVSVAFDGTSYWSASGGGTLGDRLAQYDAAGALLGTFAPGLDFRSVFTNAAGDVFARQWADNKIWQQTAPGVFAPSGVALAGAALDNQSSVVLNGAQNEYVAMSNGGVQHWDLNGNFLGSIPLTGFGTLFGEDLYPQNRGIAVGDHWLTYSNGFLSAWDQAGTRIGTAQLLGAGTTFDSFFSLSYANGMVFVVDGPGGLWRGYQLEATAVPEPASLFLLGTGIATVATRFRRRRRQ